MFKTRLLTAVFLLLGVFLALFCLPPSGWVVCVTLVSAVAAWEWGALMVLSNLHRALLGVSVLFVAVVVCVLAPSAIGLDSGFAQSGWQFGRWFYIPAAVFWVSLVPIWMHRRWQLARSLLGVVAGSVVILPTWLALLQLKQAGGLALIAIMATVWIADTGAYVSGRTFGKNKLAPTISPGKTWEGAFGGGLAVMMYGFAMAPKLPAGLTENPLFLFFILLLLTGISIVGDLFESLLKRQVGLKDSSSILPGHGGVLDRIDSLTSTLPLVALFWLAFSH